MQLVGDNARPLQAKDYDPNSSIPASVLLHPERLMQLQSFSKCKPLKDLGKLEKRSSHQPMTSIEARGAFSLSLPIITPACPCIPPSILSHSPMAPMPSSLSMLYTPSSQSSTSALTSCPIKPHGLKGAGVSAALFFFELTFPTSPWISPSPITPCLGLGPRSHLFAPSLAFIHHQPSTTSFPPSWRKEASGGRNPVKRNATKGKHTLQAQSPRTSA